MLLSDQGRALAINIINKVPLPWYIGMLMFYIRSDLIEKIVNLTDDDVWKQLEESHAAAGAIIRSRALPMNMEQ